MRQYPLLALFVLLFASFLTSGCSNGAMRNGNGSVTFLRVTHVSKVAEMHPKGEVICCGESIVLDHFSGSADLLLRINSMSFSAKNTFEVPAGLSMQLRDCTQISPHIKFVVHGKLEIRDLSGVLDASFVVNKGATLLLDNVTTKDNLSSIIASNDADTISIRNVRVVDSIGNFISGSATNLIIKSSSFTSQVTKSCLINITVDFADITENKFSLDCSDEISSGGERCMNITAIRAIYLNRNCVNGYRFSYKSNMSRCITLYSGYIECHNNTFHTIRSGPVLRLYGVFTSCLDNIFRDLTATYFVLHVNSYRGARVCGNVFRDVILNSACTLCIFGKCQTISNNIFVSCCEKRSSILILLPFDGDLRDNCFHNNRVLVMFTYWEEISEHIRNMVFININMQCCSGNYITFIVKSYKHEESAIAEFLKYNTINERKHTFTFSEEFKRCEYETLIFHLCLEPLTWLVCFVQKLRLKYEPMVRIDGSAEDEESSQ